MFKVLIFARRNPALDRAAFISRYEKTHLALTDRLIAQDLIPPMVDYRRNYLVRDDALNSGPIPDFDVVTEAWYENRAMFEANREAVSKSEFAQEIFEDLSALLDIESMAFVVAEEWRGTDAMGRS